MRVHCSARDSDFWRNTFRNVPAVILNGHWMQNVVMADDHLGMVEIIACDRSGRPEVTNDGRDVVTKTLRGNVQIIGARLDEHVH